MLRRPKNSKKEIVVVLVVLFIALIIAFGNLFLRSPQVKAAPTCGDGTFYGTCSLNKPYFCNNGTLVAKPSVCGCGDYANLTGNSCTSQYQTSPKNVTFEYILNGTKGEIKFIAYKGLVDYLSNLSSDIYYQGNQTPSRADFDLKKINNPYQEQMLMPLVAEIQNIAPDKLDQFRVAVSLVQNIPYGNSNKTFSFFGQELNYSKSPYEVVYSGFGNCEEKSRLLAFILRSLGYSTALFYYPQQNHEALGVKCPVNEGLGNTSYCFVETSGPSIITDNSMQYQGGVTLNNVQPETFLLSQGISLPKNMYEYNDAKTLENIREGNFVLFSKSKFEQLKSKYGLTDFYALG